MELSQEQRKIIIFKRNEKLVQEDKRQEHIKILGYQFLKGLRVKRNIFDIDYVLNIIGLTEFEDLKYWCESNEFLANKKNESAMVFSWTLFDSMRHKGRKIVANYNFEKLGQWNEYETDTMNEKEVFETRHDIMLNELYDIKNTYNYVLGQHTKKKRTIGELNELHILRLEKKKVQSKIRRYKKSLIKNNH